MLCRMSPLYSVRLKESIFVGGGDTEILDDRHTVYEYHPQEDQWMRLPKYECVFFAMTVLNNRLTLVGGLKTSSVPLKVTNQIAVWETEGKSQEWTYPYPPMITPRHSPAVATYNMWLVVAGGMKSGLNLATVEVLHTTSRQWWCTSPLPVKCRNMTSAIIQNELFLVGGSLTTQTLVISLHDLIQGSASSAITKTLPQWRTLSPPPLNCSAALPLRGSLLAIGGRHGNDARSTAIHTYQPATNSWSKVGDLPSARSHCSCTLLPSGDILVAGGTDSNGKLSSRVDTASL